MDVAIIGSGNVGGALAASMARAGHAITISSNDRTEAEQVAASTGARLVESNREAVQGADVTIVAIPPDAFADLAAELRDALSGKTVVDVANRPTPDPAREGCTSHAEEFQASVPDARVIKAFNTVFAARQAQPDLAGVRADGFVAGDDEQAKDGVLTLVGSIGLRPLDAGPLVVARTLEGMGWLHITLAMRNNWSWQTAWKLVGPTGG